MKTDHFKISKLSYHVVYVLISFSKSITRLQYFPDFEVDVLFDWKLLLLQISKPPQFFQMRQYATVNPPKKLFPLNILFWDIFSHDIWAFMINDIAQKMKFSIMEFFSKHDQIRRKLRIWSHLLKISLMENFIFCAAL